MGPPEIDLRRLRVGRRHRVVEVYEPAIGRPCRPVLVHTAQPAGDFARVSAVSIGNPHGVTCRTPRPEKGDLRAIRRPAHGAGALHRFARNAAERCRNDPRLKQRRAASRGCRIERDGRPVRRDGEPSDVGLRLQFELGRRRQVDRLAGGEELHPHVGRSTRVRQVRHPFSVGRQGGSGLERESACEPDDPRKRRRHIDG